MGRKHTEPPPELPAPPAFELVDDDERDEQDYTDEPTDLQPDFDDPHAEVNNPERLQMERPAAHSTRAAGRTKAGEDSSPPEYLTGLLRLPGVPGDILEGLDHRKAWIRVKTRGVPETACPLAHLAPDALEVLAEHGHGGHARCELAPEENSRDVRFFGCVLPALDGDDDDTDDDRDPVLFAMMRQSEERTARLEAAILQLAKAQNERDPFTEFERMLGFFERVSGSLGGMGAGAPNADTEITKQLLELLGPKLIEKLMPGAAADA